MSWNDEDEDQAWSDGAMDDQVDQWRCDGVDEDEIRDMAGRHYKPPKGAVYTPVAYAVDEESTGVRASSVVVPSMLVDVILDSWGNYDASTASAQAALLVIAGKVNEIPGTPKQIAYLGGLAEKYIAARTRLVETIGMPQTEELVIMARIGLAWVTLPMRVSNQAGALIDGFLGGPAHKHTHATPQSPYGLASAIIAAADALDCTALGMSTLIWLSRLRELLPTLRRWPRDFDVQPSDYDPYMTLPKRKNKRKRKVQNAD